MDYDGHAGNADFEITERAAVLRDAIEHHPALAVCYNASVATPIPAVRRHVDR